MKLNSYIHTFRFSLGISMAFRMILYFASLWAMTLTALYYSHRPLASASFSAAASFSITPEFTSFLLCVRTSFLMFPIFSAFWDLHLAYDIALRYTSYTRLALFGYGFISLGGLWKSTLSFTGISKIIYITMNNNNSESTNNSLYNLRHLQ